MKEYLRDINNIVFDMDMIYWDSKKKVYNFCYYPFTEQGMKEGLNGLFLELLERLNHNDREAVVIGYGLQQKIISENFTITELKEYVAENIKMPGNNINKYSYEKAKKSNYYNEKQNDDLEDLDNIIEEDADEYFDSTDFENDNINKRFSNKNEKERKQYYHFLQLFVLVVQPYPPSYGSPDFLTYNIDHYTIFLLLFHNKFHIS